MLEARTSKSTTRSCTKHFNTDLVPVLGQKPTRVEDVQCPHRKNDHATIEDVEVNFCADDVTSPSVREL